MSWHLDPKDIEEQQDLQPTKKNTENTELYLQKCYYLYSFDF